MLTGAWPLPEKSNNFSGPCLLAHGPCPKSRTTFRGHASGRFQPDPVVVEGAAGGRGRLVRAGERIDALPVLEGFVRPDRFGDEHPAAHAVMRLCVQGDDATGAAEPH